MHIVPKDYSKFKFLHESTSLYHLKIILKEQYILLYDQFEFSNLYIHVFDFKQTLRKQFILNSQITLFKNRVRVISLSPIAQESTSLLSKLRTSKLVIRWSLLLYTNTMRLTT